MCWTNAGQRNKKKHKQLSRCVVLLPLLGRFIISVQQPTRKCSYRARQLDRHTQMCTNQLTAGPTTSAHAEREADGELSAEPHCLSHGGNCGGLLLLLSLLWCVGAFCTCQHDDNQPALGLPPSRLPMHNLHIHTCCSKKDPAAIPPNPTTPQAQTLIHAT